MTREQMKCVGDEIYAEKDDQRHTLSEIFRSYIF